jgi:MFS family permease
MSSFMWLPVAIPRIFGTTSATVGMQMGGTLAVATLAGFALPPIANKLVRGDLVMKPLRLARWFFIVALLPTLAFSFITAPWQAYLAAGCQLMLLLAVAAMMPGVLQSIAPRHLRARVLAMLGIVGALAQGAAPLLVGAISGMIKDPRGILTAIVLVGTPGLILAIILVSFALRPLGENGKRGARPRRGRPAKRHSAAEPKRAVIFFHLTGPL